MGKVKETRQNRTGPRNFDICFCVNFSGFDQSFFLKGDWVLGYSSNQLCDFPNICKFLKILSRAKC